MTKKNLLIIALLLSPFISWAQVNAEATNFKLTVVDKVLSLNAEIDKLSSALKKARETNSGDTVTLKDQRKVTVAKCFQIPQDYIKANPSSPYSCQALGMLGSGGKKSPVSVLDLERLFNSLAPELRNGNAGKAYAANLESWKERDKLK